MESVCVFFLVTHEQLCYAVVWIDFYLINRRRNFKMTFPIIGEGNVLSVTIFHPLLGSYFSVRDLRE